MQNKKIINNVEELLGDTPIFKLNKMFEGYNVYAKLEYFNPSFSIKDRAAFNMIRKKIETGEIKKGDYIIEATSGNTGLGLCVASIVYELKFIAVVFDDVSKEKINLLKGYGASVIICDSNLNSKEKGGYVWVAEQLSKKFNNIHYINQFSNEDNPDAHYISTGPEIWEQLNGKIDYFINTVGTGGTITGISKYLKQKNGFIKTIAVEPVGGIYKDYYYGKKMVFKDHLIHFISDNFISPNFKKEYIDDVIQIEDIDSFKSCIDLMRTEGLCVGTSSGCTIAAIKKMISEELIDKNDTVVCTFADNGIKYCDSLFNLKYLKEHHLNYDFMNQESDCNKNIKKYLSDQNIDFEVM